MNETEEIEGIERDRRDIKRQMGLNEIEEKEGDRRDCTRQKRQKEIEGIE